MPYRYAIHTLQRIKVSFALQKNTKKEKITRNMYRQFVFRSLVNKC